MLITLLLWTLAIVVALIVIPWLIGIRYIPHNKVGIVEKFWSHKGSLTDGRIVALRWRSRFSSRTSARRSACGILPVAIPHTQRTAGHDCRKQDRLHLRA